MASEAPAWPSIRSVTPEELDGAARTLAAAFEEYPWTRWSIPEDSYRDRLEQLQRLYLGHALEHGVILVEDDLHGVLALLPPQAPEPSSSLQEQIAARHGSRLEALAGAVTPPPPEAAWNLATLGVHPEWQGRGLGRALVEAALEHVSRVDGAAVALETSDERNVRLYEGAGFRVTSTSTLEGGPVVVSMLRSSSGRSG
ncbi:acetyltransferase (GNAT) family protein [Bogoriella caseilytica]|uniref:Acetyltransferase (GNAT) family protein n=2 Tax=Bogoriella caseilytica TaxID=56055 RepID=A0A3N2BA78_9MICO|nr:acetyltransferase (GNAT) family protein [Bogoriella caseilytica]